MTTKWPRLPNTVHIDKVMASLKDHPEKWVKAYRDARGLSGASYVAANEAYNAAWAKASRAIRDAVCKAVPTYYPGLCTILALSVYDDSAHLLDSSTEEIRLLVALGHPYAILMLPAVTAFQRIDGLTV